MTNYMAEVAKILGVELDEEFKVREYTYKLTNNGLVCTMFPQKDEEDYEHMLRVILTGEYPIKRKPWKPRVGEQFYFIDMDGKSCCLTCGYNNSSLNLYKIGNCYRTREAAKANTEKWVKFYSSDNVVEV